MNISTEQKQTHRHRDQICGCQDGMGRKRDALGIWSWQMQTITFRMDKQQGPTVQTENYIQSSGISCNQKEYYIYKTGL